MTACELLVVGGGPAAHSAAKGYRDAGGRGAVVMLAGERRFPYNRPPLSKELLRSETGPEALALEPLEDVTVRHDEALALHPAQRRVGLAGGESITYTSVVLATGAEPVRPPIDGAEQDHVHVLRTVADALALRAAAVPGARVLVMGSGFIGCEAAVSLRARGCAVDLVSQEPAPQVARLGDAVAARLARWLAEAGVEASYDTELTAIDPRYDVVLLAGGVRPRTELARAAGVALAADGEIAADASMRTSVPGVLACGDCCRAEHALAGRPLHVEHWGDALAQGEVAGWTAAGKEARWDTVPGFWSTIGSETIKYAAWGDGFETTNLIDHGDGAFTAWYGDDQGVCVGVLTHDRDPDYETGIRLIERRGARP